MSPLEELYTTKEESELIQRIQKGDKTALEKLTREYLRYVISVANQHQNQGVSLPDLIHEGNKGLVKAAENFDETRGFKFISYAVWHIRQSILHALAEQSRIARPPLKIESSLLDALMNSDSDSVLINESQLLEIERALTMLTERERNIFKMFFGIGVQKMTLEEIGEKYGLTRERVRLIKEKAIRRLRYRVSRNIGEKQMILTLTFEYSSGDVKIKMSGTNVATIDWGDESPSEIHPLSTDCLVFRHRYPDKTDRTITITGVNITELDCSEQYKFVNLDVSQNTALRKLTCSRNVLKNLDVSNNVALTWLDCQMNGLVSLDVSKNVELKYLNCHGNDIKNLDISNNIMLSELACGANKFKSLDVSANIALTKLNCFYGKLTSIDVSKNLALKELECSENKLTILDVSNNAALEKLWCNKNRLTGLDISKNPALKNLNCSGNKFSADALYATLSSSKGTKSVNDIYDEDNVNPFEMDDDEYEPIQMTLTFENIDEATFQLAGSGTITIDWGDGTQSETHSLTSSDPFSAESYWHMYSDNSTYTVTITGNNIEHLDCYETSLTSLDVSKNPALIGLSCVNGKITNLDISNNEALENLLCLANKLTNLDVSKNTLLTKLGCNENKITHLDVSKNIELVWLECWSNELANLDVSKNTKLTHLFCSGNYISEVDVSKNTSLIKLECSYNDLSAEALNSFFETLPLVEEGKLDISDNPGTNGCDTNIAMKKGWKLPKQMFLTVQGAGDVTIQLAGTEMMRILWNEDFCSMEELSYEYTDYTHTYTEEKAHEIIITGENITALYCGNNRITSLDVSGNAALTELGCYENRITHLDLSKNTALTKLHCWSNLLTELDVSANTELTELDCRNNRFTENVTQIQNPVHEAFDNFRILS